MSQVRFLSIAEFKTLIGAEKLIMGTTKNEKKVMTNQDGSQTFKCQTDFDPSKEKAVLIPESGDLNEACLVNVDRRNILEKIFDVIEL